MKEETLFLAERYLLGTGRELEKAMLAYEFYEGSLETVLNELKRYQNDDGGFGHALEPDVRLELSSVISSTVALQILTRYQVSSEHSIVRKVIHFLLNVFQENNMGWEIVPQAVEDYPAAPWWKYAGVQANWGNPNAEILGYLIQYEDLVPPSLITNLTQQAISYINNLETYEFHELLCFLRLKKHLSDSNSAKMEDKLLHMIKQCVITDEAKWTEYGLQPIDVVSSPESPYYELLNETWEKNLQFRISQQDELGSWNPSWSWFGEFENIWPLAEKEWRSVLTFNMIRLLKNLERK
ncbi:hypothetical protein [Bacillus sp. 2205SS5-2]|uniref:hypothetical protein n=1 Tax=Bacillus sp. 2205SS5-2 TaxID=3109031 RepID=UPI003007D8CE